MASAGGMNAAPTEMIATSGYILRQSLMMLKG